MNDRSVTADKNLGKTLFGIMCYLELLSFFSFMSHVIGWHEWHVASFNRNTCTQKCMHQLLKLCFFFLYLKTSKFSLYSLWKDHAFIKFNIFFFYQSSLILWWFCWGFFLHSISKFFCFLLCNIIDCDNYSIIVMWITNFIQ